MVIIPPRWKIIHDLSGKKSSVKVNKRDGTAPNSDINLLAGWKEYFSSLLNKSDGQSPSELPPPAATDLSENANPPTREETLLAKRQVKNNTAAGLDSAITAEALQNGGDAMVDGVHDFCAEVYSGLKPLSQWTTCHFSST